MKIQPASISKLIHVPNRTSLNCANREFPPREPGGPLAAIVGKCWRVIRNGWRSCAVSLVKYSLRGVGCRGKDEVALMASVFEVEGDDVLERGESL